MRVLVIGGTEFISLHLVRALQRDRHEVTVLNRGRRPERAAAGVRTLVADRKDAAALRRALAGERFDGLVDVTYAPTTGEDVQALLAALEGRVGHAIFVSTGRVHDHAVALPISETTPRTLYWGEYARLKIAGEDAYMASGVPATVVRPTHVYGPLNTRNNETFFFDRLVRGRPILVPGDGGWLRQFGHVEDLADAMAAMLGDRRAMGQSYNVTGEEVVTQVGFVDLVADVVGRRATVVYAPNAPFGQNLAYDCHAVYTTTKIRRDLGIRPRYTLAAGLAQTYEWYRREALDRRDVDFKDEDALLATLA
ncbi:MAG TPA: NAD-dependent epimerase/dehydratase family protein [Methylomirabilota bacterium]|jgi:nucleoside-diphosphate-sugar epimerase|nr:NAD-dependent epimerase/dehydratase family protein [Methylomirabilota bacterium]